MGRRARTPLTAVAAAVLLSGCILFPPWFVDPFAGDITVQNQTDANWIVRVEGGFIDFAVGANASGTMQLFGAEATALVLLDEDCEEVDSLDWDGSASGLIIQEPGSLSATDEELGPDEPDPLNEYFECTGGFGVEPEAVTALPEAGGAITLSSGDGTSFILDVGAATIEPLGEGSVETGEFDVEFAWSPDGSQLAIARVAGSGTSTDIYLADADGANAELRIEDATSPRWSPDGTAISYVSADPFASATTLAIFDVATGETEVLAEDAAAATWSPSGEQLAFVTEPPFGDPFDVPTAELKIVNADGSGLRRLADAYPFSTSPSWSPDGARLAFVGLPDGADPGASDLTTVLAIHDLETDATSVLVEIEDTMVGEPAWSPDGETIAFTLAAADMFDVAGALAVVAADGGAVTRLDEEVSAYYTTPIWSPDGAWVAVTWTGVTGLSGTLTAVKLDGTDEVVLATGVLAAADWRSDVR